MKIKEKFSKDEMVISLDIFPSSVHSSKEKICDTVDLVKELSPDFISFHYGTHEDLLDIAIKIKKECNITCMPRITCTSTSRGELSALLDRFKENEIDNLFIVRGDVNDKMKSTFAPKEHFKYASDLVKDAKQYGDNYFSIGAACYPMGHMESGSKVSDLMNLKRKVIAGSDFLISQFFFDNFTYYQFLEECKAVEINVPICAGILPIFSLNQLKRLAPVAGSIIPKKLLASMEKYDGDQDSSRLAGEEYALEQIIDLISHGVQGIHIYTMDKPEIAEKNTQEYFWNKTR